MFSLENVQRTQYVPQVSSIPETIVSLPGIAASSGPSKQVDVSTEIRVLSNFSKYLTANDEIQQAGDPAIVYSNGFKLDYLDGLKNLPLGQACVTEETRKVVTSYVGNAVVPIVDPPNIVFCQGPITKQTTQISLCQ
jgi:hypothetical protein